MGTSVTVRYQVRHQSFDEMERRENGRESGRIIGKYIMKKNAVLFVHSVIYHDLYQTKLEG